MLEAGKTPSASRSNLRNQGARSEPSQRQAWRMAWPRKSRATPLESKCLKACNRLPLAAYSPVEPQSEGEVHVHDEPIVRNSARGSRTAGPTGRPGQAGRT